MNNTLDITRLGKVVKHDAMSFFQNLSLSLIILWAIPVVIWLISSLTPGHSQIYSFSRINIIGILAKIIIIMAPAVLYKTCNDSRKGIGYAMLPASALEKFISMVFYCFIVTPIVYLLGAFAIDSFLAVIGGPYHGFAIVDYFDKIAQYKELFREKMMIDPEEFDRYSNLLSPTVIIITKILSILMLSSIFMFGNMVFKKRKTGKMIGILILLFIILMIIMVNFVANHEDWIYRMLGDFTEENAPEVIKHIIYITIRASIIFSSIVSAVMLWLTYYKIKTQKY